MDELNERLEERAQEAQQAARLIGLEALSDPVETYQKLFADDKKEKRRRRKNGSSARTEEDYSEVGEARWRR